MAEIYDRSTLKSMVPRSWEAPRWLRTLLLILLGLAIPASIVLALRPQAVPVDIVTVERGLLEVAVEENGRTRVRDRYLVSAPISGTLLRVEHVGGDRIDEGDLLFRVASPEVPLPDVRTRAQLRARLQAARATLDAAGAQLEVSEAGAVDARQELLRQEVLAETGAGTVAGLERAQALVRAREAEVRSTGFRIQAAGGEVEDLRLALERPAGAGDQTVAVAAPTSGNVLRVVRESSGPVLAGEPVLEIGNPQAIEVVVDFLSADAVRLRPGLEAEITGWGGDQVLRARVRMVEPSAFTQISALGIEEQRVNVILDPKGAGWDLLGDGFRVEARVLINRLENVLRLPSGSVFRSGEGWAVFLLGDSRVEETQVEVGSRTPDAAEILSGVAEGDRVVLYPSDRVADEVRVRER